MTLSKQTKRIPLPVLRRESTATNNHLTNGERHGSRIVTKEHSS